MAPDWFYQARLNTRLPPRERSSTVELQPSKLMTRVRLPPFAREMPSMSKGRMQAKGLLLLLSYHLAGSRKTVNPLVWGTRNTRSDSGEPDATKHCDMKRTCWKSILT